VSIAPPSGCRVYPCTPFSIAVQKSFDSFQCFIAFFAFTHDSSQFMHSLIDGHVSMCIQSSSFMLHMLQAFPTVVPLIFPPIVTQVVACLADIYLSFFLSFKSRFIFSPGDAVEGILCPFFLVYDVCFQLTSESCEANCCFIPLVAFVPSINTVAFSTGQCGQLGLALYGPRALARVVSASKSAGMLSQSSRVRYLPSRSACPFTHCTLVGMSLHHSSRRVWYVFYRS
jgi:hypothetical protein